MTEQPIARMCRMCRWWTGDREGHQSYGNESRKHGHCFAIHASQALPEKIPARLYPQGTIAWLETRFDFSCSLWEG